MPMSWHTMMDFEPPLVGFVLSDGDYSYETLRKTKECVLNIPTVDLVAKIVACGNCSGAKVDKFAAFGLTADPASKVSAPLVRECWVNLEAKLVDTKMVTKYGFFIVEVVKAWITPTPKRPCTVHHEGQGEFMVSGPTIRLRSSKA
jgi:flavin reductase (DIM6/NTAB) family NADH-FMN oxidoreductase RutF